MLIPLIRPKYYQFSWSALHIFVFVTTSRNLFYLTDSFFYFHYQSVPYSIAIDYQWVIYYISHQIYFPVSFQFKLMLSHDGSGKGAALVAAVANRLLEKKREAAKSGTSV